MTADEKRFKRITSRKNKSDEPGKLTMSSQLHIPDSGIKIDVSVLPAATTVELFGHVTLVEGYALASFIGCHALIALRDTPGKTVAVLTGQQRLQTLLEAALETGNLIAFWGQKLVNPPTPRGGSWTVEVYSIDGVILFNSK
jgi:hypothetical protein